jgi:hypothetical protein
MRLTRDEIQSLAKRFKTYDPHPPLTALCAFASLLADDELVEAIGESFTAEQRAVWVLTGVTDASLIRVRASSACDRWSWERPGTRDEHRDEKSEATLWPLSAVRSLNVTRVRDTTEPGDNGKYEWEADRALTLRGGEVISFPSSDAVLNSADSERVALLMAVIRSHL